MSAQRVADWILQHRLLLIILTVGLILGIREFQISREREPLGWLTEEGQRVMEVIAAVNPEDPDTHFFNAMRALAGGDLEGFEDLMERAMSTNVKHNEMLERFYVQYLVGAGAELEQVNRALNRWRRNHPFAPGMLEIYMAPGPSGSGEAALLERRLSGIRWVDQVELESHRDDDGPYWQANLGFRRGRVIDVREAVDRVVAVVPATEGLGLGIGPRETAPQRTPGSGWHPW